MILISRWHFALQNIQATSNHPNPQGARLPAANCGGADSFSFCAAKMPKLHRSISPRKGYVCPTPTAGEQSGDRQRREKALPFLKEEKSEHERARTSMLAVRLCCARHCELPLSKMGNKGLFPGVAVPLAFFCTLFFRHRKKSVNAPWDGQSLSAPESARQSPPKGNFLRQSCRLSMQAGGFPRGKQSARFALPCVPLVVCLNSGSLTAFGGCIHWIPASLRSPQSPSDRLPKQSSVP